ncbi:MAG: cupin domain-containing protein [Planctomycetes bacterium]|nr:cupin domain-containing protein [Planctomycetota bacterium]
MNKLPRPTLALLLVAGLSVMGCRHLRRLETPFLFPLVVDPRMIEVEKALADNAIADTDDLRITDLGESKGHSVHLVQSNADLKPHFRKRHDELILVRKGGGIAILGEDRYIVGPGSVLIVPRGTIHRFINTGEKPFIALSVLSPAYDGKDWMPVKQKKK